MRIGLRLWADDGARDLAHWLWMRYGISDWKARRFIDAANALGQLPRVTEALTTGALGVDKVVELTRFATDETEDGLVEWAARVSAARIRHEGEVLRRVETDEAAHDDEVRAVSWSYRDEGRRFEMHADLPAAQGATVAQAIDRMSATIPPMPGERAGGPGQRGAPTPWSRSARQDWAPMPIPNARRSWSTRAPVTRPAS